MTDFAQARLDMFESGLFGQGNAFWRWIATDEARPYLTAFAVDRAPPSGSEFFAARANGSGMRPEGRDQPLGYLGCALGIQIDRFQVETELIVFARELRLDFS